MDYLTSHYDYIDKKISEWLFLSVGVNILFYTGVPCKLFFLFFFSNCKKTVL